MQIGVRRQRRALLILLEGVKDGSTQGGHLCRALRWKEDVSLQCV